MDNSYMNMQQPSNENSSNEQTDHDNKKTFSHFSFTTRGIFKGFTANDKGTFFAKISLPNGQVDGKQSYINVSAVVANLSSLQALAATMLDLEINDGRGTSAEVTLTNMLAKNSYDNDGIIRCDTNNVAYINYHAFLNGIAFTPAN